MRKRPTLQDIANLAGVSKWTACQALKNSSQLAEETKKKIQRIAKKIGYQLNAFASALTRSKTNNTAQKGTLAYIIGHPNFNSLANDFDKAHPHLAEKYHLALSGARHQAQKYGYQLNAFWAYDPAHKGKRLDRILQARGIHGAILFHLRESELQLDWSKYACAYADLSLGFRNDTIPIHFSFTATDYYQTTFSAVSYLLKNGYQKIGMFMWGHYEERQNHIFYGAYQGAHQACSISPPKRIPPYYWKEIEDEKKFSKWIARYQPEVLITPGGIPGISYETSKAMNFAPNLTVSGLRIPKDIELFHLNLDISLQRNQISGLFISHDKLTAAAVDLIIGQLHRNEYGPKKPTELKSVFLQPEWTEGKTLLRK